MIAWIMGTKIGRYVAIVGVVLAAAWAVWWSTLMQGRAQGRAQEQSKQKDTLIHVAQTRAQVDTAVAAEPDPVSRLRDRWSR
jgi:hypothetical protein